ncbi:hypothetical protein [Streptomyces sp. NPDC005046]
MAKNTHAVAFCNRCGLPISPGTATLWGPSAPARHITVPGKPEDCPE